MNRQFREAVRLATNGFTLFLVLILLLNSNLGGSGGGSKGFAGTNVSPFTLFLVLILLIQGFDSKTVIVTRQLMETEMI